MELGDFEGLFAIYCDHPNSRLKIVLRQGSRKNFEIGGGGAQISDSILVVGMRGGTLVTRYWWGEHNTFSY